MLGCEHGSLPYLAFLTFAITGDQVNVVWSVLDFAAKRHTNSQ